MTGYQKYYLFKEIQQRNPVLIKSVREHISSKSRICVYCGCEIVKGDYYYSYKPYFGKRKARCLDHSPKIYNDVERFDV